MLFKRNKKKKIANQERAIVVTDSHSAKVEGYNRLRDNVLFLNADGKNKIIQIESSVMHEGKTTVSCNLAVSLGLSGKKVVVVDLDFKKSNVHRTFKIDNTDGLSEYMLGTIDYDKLIKHTEYKNVDLINRGAEVYNSSVIFIATKFKELIEKLRQEYDYVLLDCAPVLQVSDFINILPVSDGVLFLVAYGLTTRNQVTEAIKELQKNGANILGMVFTMYDRKRDKTYGYGKYYGKGYYSYYRSYIEEGDAKATPKKDAEKK